MQTNSQNLNKSYIPFVLLLLGSAVSEISSFLPYFVFYNPTGGRVTINGVNIALGFFVLILGGIIAVLSAFKFNNAVDRDEIRSSRNLALIDFICSILSIVLYDFIGTNEGLNQFESRYGQYLSNGSFISISFGIGV